MNNNRNNKFSLLYNIKYWAIRIWSFVVFCFWLMIIFMMLTISEDFTPKMIPFIVSGIIVIICLIISWRWMYWGGIAVIISSIPVWIADWYLLASYRDPSQHTFLVPSIFSLLLIITGLLLVLFYRHQYHKSKTLSSSG